MSDTEKVLWLTALLCILGAAFLPLTIIWVGAPAAVMDSQAAVGNVLLFVLVSTFIYLLILSWRTAYLSGKRKR